MSATLEEENNRLKDIIEKRATLRRKASIKWALNNKDKVQLYNQKYISLNRELINEKQKKYQSDNIDHYKQYQSEYRAKKKSEKFQQKLKDDIAWNEHKKKIVEDIENVKFPIKGFENMDN